MIAVDELDRIARARLHDAKSLLAAGRFDGAIYVCGYAVAVWKADSRYNSIGTARQAATESLIQATEELLEALGPPRNWWSDSPDSKPRLRRRRVTLRCSLCSCARKFLIGGI